MSDDDDGDGVTGDEVDDDGDDGDDDDYGNGRWAATTMVTVQRVTR
jgi:hypothetical protein